MEEKIIDMDKEKHEVELQLQFSMKSVEGVQKRMIPLGSTFLWYFIVIVTFIFIFSVAKYEQKIV